jgi:hypothetical protein
MELIDIGNIFKITKNKELTYIYIKTYNLKKFTINSKDLSDIFDEGDQVLIKYHKNLFVDVNKIIYIRIIKHMI